MPGGLLGVGPALERGSGIGAHPPLSWPSTNAEDCPNAVIASSLSPGLSDPKATSINCVCAHRGGIRRRRPRIEVGDGDVVAGIIRDDLAPKAAVAPVGYSSSGVCSVPYGPDRVGTFAKRSPS